MSTGQLVIGWVMDLENLDYNMRLFILVVFAFVYSQKPPAFGTLLGSYQGVDAYSNFRSETNGINYEYENYQDGIYTGLKYECVEYARRFLITRKNLTFESLPCALDIWHLNFLFDINTENQVLLKRIQNGSKCEPIEGDLLIYRKNSIAEYGHVAIITEVSKGSIKIAEQNWDNTIWPGNYSRSLKVIHSHDELFIVDKDNSIIGWMTYSSSKHPESCFDLDCSSCTPADTSKFCNYH